MTLTLADLQARARQEVTFTLECSGNSAFPFIKGLVGNATLGGHPAGAACSTRRACRTAGIEVVFWGADAGGRSGARSTITEQFARSMSLADALAPTSALLRDERGPAAARARLPGCA